MKTNHHVWDEENYKCLKCGIQQSKASSLKLGCSKKAAVKAGRRSRKPRKRLSE